MIRHRLACNMNFKTITKPIWNCISKVTFQEGKPV